jgi:predicted MFS family arabinose efflux permease
MTLLGAGEVIGGTLVGFIKDKTSNTAAILCEILLCAVGFTIVMLVNSNDKYDYMSYLMAFFWGI